MKTIYQQRGTTLIEVLIAAVILSIGLLGMAGLQVDGMKKRKIAEMKALACQTANDLTDRMRANMTATKAQEYDMTAVQPALNANCVGPAGCSSQQMALNDLAEWNTSINNNFPGGTGFACITSNPGAIGRNMRCNGRGDVYVISIRWQDQLGQAQEFRMSFRP